MLKDQMYDEIYEAALNAAEAMGDDIKGLSWFGKNKNKLTPEQILAELDREDALKG